MFVRMWKWNRPLVSTENETAVEEKNPTSWLTISKEDVFFS